MQNPDHLSAAAVALRRGRYAEAIALCGAQLRGATDDAQALHLRGLAYHLSGDSESAVADLQQAIQQSPMDSAMLANLGRVLAAKGSYGESLEFFERAISFNPDSSAEIEDYGTALCCLNRIEEGAAAFERVLSLDSRRSSALLKLARVRVSQARHADAIDLVQRAVAADRNCILKAKAVEGLIILSQGRPREAVSLFTEVLDRDSVNTEARAGRARAYQRLGLLDLARADAEAGIVVPSSDLELAYLAGSIETDLGAFQRGKEIYDRILVRRPGSFRARWGGAMALPVIYDSAEQIDAIRSEWRAAVEVLDDDLRLDTDEQINEAVEALNTSSNFSLNYDGYDDRVLQELYGRIVHRISRAKYPQFGQPVELRKTTHERPRVGFLTRFLHDTSLWKTHGAWVTDTKGEFEKYVFYTGTEGTPDLLARAQSIADVFVHEPDMRRLIFAIAAQKLDLLIYLDHGVRIDLQMPAALWLAPVQCNGLAHPITSGLPTLTHGISSALMEPADGQVHYTERLITLPNTASCFRFDRIAKVLDHIGSVERRSDQANFLCSQNLRKYLPQHDEVFVRIAAELPTAKFHFIEGPSHATHQFWRRLHRAFARHGLDAERHCQLHASMNIDDYFRLNLQCDVFLDSMIWSGNNTAHEAAACGLPIVTLPGSMMRGRHCLAILQRLGLTDTIAADLDEYVQIAIKLARDADWRQHLNVETIRRRNRLFDDPEPVGALQSVISSLCSGEAMSAFGTQPQITRGSD